VQGRGGLKLKTKNMKTLIQRLNDTGENSDWIDVAIGSVTFLSLVAVVLGLSTVL